MIELVVITIPSSVSDKINPPESNSRSRFKPFCEFLDRYELEYQISQYVLLWIFNLLELRMLKSFPLLTDLQERIFVLK